MAIRIPIRISVTNTEAVKASTRARTRRQREQVLAIAADEAVQTDKLVQRLIPRLTGFSADRVRIKFSNGGYSWWIGFLRSDFIGKKNPVTNQIVRSFYIWYRIRGTRKMVGYDFLSIALEQRRSINRRRLAAVTKG